MSGTVPNDKVNIDAIHAELDAINVQVLALMERGRALGEDAAAVLTDAAFDAGILVCMQPAIAPIAHPDGGMIEEGRPAGWGPVTTEQRAALEARVALNNTMVTLFDTPLPNAAQSFAQMIRAGGRRFRAQP